MSMALSHNKKCHVYIARQSEIVYNTTFLFLRSFNTENISALDMFIQNYKEGENCYECSFINLKYCFGGSFPLDLMVSYS